MDYGMIGKIEKARRYAREPERVTLHTLTALFTGDNNTYIVHLTPEGWDCSCPGYSLYNNCSHVMALEKMFRPMLKRQPLPYGAGQNMVSDVQKAAHYANEKDRVQIQNFTATFEGENSAHNVRFEDGGWDCECDFFRSRATCCHTMALERILGSMIRVRALAGVGD